MKSKIFKILFILSFIPYVYMLYSILCGRYTLNGVEINGIDRILNRAAFVFPYYVRNVPIIPACLTFQMCYLNRKKGNMMFMCTFIPLLFTLLVGLLCVFGGASLMGKPIYGIDGFKLGVAGCLYTYVLIIPIFPICLIFQIGYLISKKAKKQ